MCSSVARLAILGGQRLHGWVRANGDQFHFHIQRLTRPAVIAIDHDGHALDGEDTHRAAAFRRPDPFADRQRLERLEAAAIHLADTRGVAQTIGLFGRHAQPRQCSFCQANEARPQSGQAAVLGAGDEFERRTLAG
jgi:hypothetical protein